MAATNGVVHDPLTLLRESITSHGTVPIPTTSPDPTSQAESNVSLAEASYLIFNTQSPQHGAHHIAIPLTQATRFLKPQDDGTQLPVDLRSLYFAWTHKDTTTAEYLNAVQQLRDQLEQAGKPDDKVISLAFSEKSELVTWLAGDLGLAESEYIRSADDTDASRQQASDAVATAAAAARAGDKQDDVEMRDASADGATARQREEARLQQIYSGERRLGDRNTVLRGVKAQDFAGVRKYAPAFLSRDRSGAGATTNGTHHGNPKSSSIPATTPALTSNPALRPPVKSSSGRRPEPIILLSPSASSLLRMGNIKSFLEDGLYASPDAGSGANILHISRTLRSVSSQPLRFILVESPDNFRPDYWSRVVAVFTTGQTWQFKNYKWQSPAELFSHALGVYVGWKGEVVPESVKGWGRGVLTVQIDKGASRWRDREVVEDIWSAVEGRMKMMGWGRDGR